MATDFWSSSHYKRWVVDRATLRQARAEDLQYIDDPQYLDFFPIYFANAISKLGKKLSLRQRVIATATVFFHRFYVKNAYCETDPFLVIAACCYVAAKAEESPVHIKNVVAEARSLFGQENYATSPFPQENSKLAEMEFYLVDDLECDLIVFHPYRTLLTLCKKESAPGVNVTSEPEAGELGTGLDDGPRYWGTGEGQLELQEGALQLAWFVINDTFRSDLCLLYPPHLIAIAAIYLTLVLHVPTHDAILNQSQSEPEKQQHSPPQPRRSSRQASNSNASQNTSKKLSSSNDPIAFLSELNVSLPLIATIVQEIISMYALWERYKEDPVPESAKPVASASPLFTGTSGAGSARSKSGSGSGSGPGSAKSQSNGPTPPEVVEDVGGWDTVSGVEGATVDSNPAGDIASGGGSMVTPVFLTGLLMGMREARLADIAHPANGRAVAVNKMLERTQAAG